MKFRRGSLPPMMPLEFVGCIGGCDETLREVLNLKYLRPGGGGGGGGGGPGSQFNAASRPQSQSRANPAPRPRADNSRPPAAPRPRVESGRPSAPPPPAPVWSSQPPVAVQNNATVCNCGQDAILLTVRKEGPNQGRQFYKCNTGNCNFFLWEDQQNDQGPGQTTGRTPQPPRPSLGFGNTSQGFGNGRPGAGNGGDTMCNCNEPAVTRTVMKDGPNKGRMFHTCGKPREQQCGFFQWADENVPPGMIPEFSTTDIKHEYV